MGRLLCCTKDVMKKIGLYLGNDPGLGAFQYCQAMLAAIEALPKSEFDVLVFYSSKAWEDYVNDMDVTAEYVPKSFNSRAISKLSHSFLFITTLWRNVGWRFDRFSKAFKYAKCDIWIFPAQDVWTYLLPVPSIAAIHDLMHRYERRFPEVSGEGLYELRERHHRQLCSWAKGILVDSVLGKQHVQDSYEISSTNIHVLPYVPPAYIYSVEVPDGFDDRYNLPEKYVFYPAQFWEHKNHNALIDAIDQLKDVFPDIKIVFAGSKKNAYESCVTRVNELQLQDRVQFLGYVPDEDMPELYRRARAMVYPTFFGPTNIPPLEAFVVGCPVAVSNIYGMPEQVGGAALLFNPKSVDEIAESIRQLWTDDRLCDELVRKGRDRAMKCTLERFSDNLVTILRTSVD